MLEPVYGAATQVPLVRVDRVGNVVLAWTELQGIGVEIRPAGAPAFQAIAPPRFAEYPIVEHLEFDHDGKAVMIGGDATGGQTALSWSTLKFPGSAEAQPPIAPEPLVKVRVPTRLVSVRVHRRSPRWFSVRVTCSTSAFGDCKGSVKLIQRVGRSPRGSIVLGSALVRRLPAGHSVTLRIRIRRVAAAASRPGPIAAVASISDARGKVRVTRGAVPARS